MLYLTTGKQPPRAWGRDKEQLKPDQQKQWNSPLPEWASDDSVTSTTVGTFDSSGNFTATAEKVQFYVHNHITPLLVISKYIVAMRLKGVAKPPLRNISFICVVYNGIWIPLGQLKLSCLTRCPHFRDSFAYNGDHAQCPDQGGVILELHT